MKAAMLLFTAGAVVLAGGGADEAALKKEKARLEGMWKITRLATPKGDQDGAVGATLTFGKDSSLEYRKDDEMKKASFKLNPAAKPKEIDITPEEDADKVMHGIYQIEKDSLKICLSKEKRPNEFAAAEGGSNILIVLEKAK